MGLWDAPRSGRKRKWQSENIEEITKKLEKEQRTYNTRQLLQILATLNGVHLSERQLRRILKKKLLMEKNKEFNKRETKTS
jgi:transposase